MNELMALENDAERARPRNREKTLFQLKLAMNRLQKKNVALSIASIAREVGVTPALIHNRYPDFAEEVRRATGKSTRAQRDAQRDLLVLEKEKNRVLRTQVETLTADMIMLASVNERLRKEIALQSAIVEGKVIKLNRAL